MFPTAQLPQDAALLDLISAAAATPDAVRDRAHALAATHAVAPPEQVERALTKILGTTGPLTWDRPTSSEDRNLQVERYRADVTRVKSLFRKQKSRFKPNNTIDGVVWSVVMAFGLAPLTAVMDKFWAAKIEWAFGILLISIFVPIVYGALREMKFDKINENHLFQLSSCQEKIRQLGACQPTSEQMARWLGYPEVADQARAWAASACGLMVRDAELLDERVAQLDAEKAQAQRLELAQQLGVAA